MEMIRCIWIVGMVVLPMVVGCGATKAVSIEDVTYQGRVDTTLPPALQAKQRTVINVLGALQEGISPEQVAQYVRGIEFRESSQQFYEGALRLVRWKFNGRPNGDAVPVELSLATVDARREQDQAQRKVERVYRVTGTPGRLTVTRK